MTYYRRIALGFWLLTIFSLLLPPVRTQGRYEHFNILRMLPKSPLPGTCYNPTPGISHYSFLTIPVETIIHIAAGEEASIGTSYLLDDNSVALVQSDFGLRSPQYFKAAPASIQQDNLSAVV